ncbi:insulinase family protein [Diaphorobacter ruginosibacter]|uniref:Insulinase family protein n=1 Tax=Diaphorobacter ruginosibacter TaxID=1715720 RepID=A0A7G9RLT2_9BURK|nr:pitrilysin family protein [Diaphorobacter ruginosibacter]QNN56557.1 insulinase family protein [Diaphorobacter ruginosibacter]
MKQAISLLGLLACAHVTAHAGASANPPSQPMTQPSGQAAASAVTAVRPEVTTADGAQLFTLKNGMQLIVKPDRRAPTAVHMVWVRVGAMDEVDGTSGVAHALEHMMFKGTAKVAPGQFSKKVAALGGQENAFTTRDYTGYYQQIPASRLKDVMELESDRFANNQWPDEEFKKEIEVIKEERRMRTEDQPRAALFEQLNAATFIASPYHRPVVGWMGDLDSMTPEDVRNFHKQWYVPSNAAIVVAGDVDPAKVLELAQQTYGQIPQGAVPARKPRTEPEQKGIRRIEFKAPADQAFLAMSFRVPSLVHLDEPKDSDRDALSLLMLSAVLSGYDGARLDRALTQGADRIADSASSSANIIGRGPSLFMLMGVPAPGKTARQVEEALRAQVARIAKEGVSEAELARVKAQWTASTVYERDSLYGQANDLGGNWVEGFPLDADDRILKLLRTVTPEQVKSVAARYFGDDQLNVGTLVPQPVAPGSKRPAAGGADGSRLH